MSIDNNIVDIKLHYFQQVLEADYCRPFDQIKSGISAIFRLKTLDNKILEF
jgi:hypothetical protein